MVNRLIAFLLALTLQAPAFAFDPYKAAQEAADGEVLDITFILNSKQFTDKQRLSMLRDKVLEKTHKAAFAEEFNNWMVEGIRRGLSTAPLQVQDSVPPDMNNADLPEFLVKECVNFNKSKGGASGLPINKLLIVGSIAVTNSQYRKMGTADDFLNFMLDNAGDIFFHIEDPNHLVKP